MSNDEICVRYRLAKNQKKQIQILADLNVTTKQEIIEVLKQVGMVVPEQEERASAKKADKPKSPRVFQFNTELAKKLYDQGLSDRQIADQLGVHNSTICSWRKHYTLPANNQKPSQTYDKSSESTSEYTENHCEPIANNSSTSQQKPQKTEINPVLHKIQKIFDMIEPGDSPKVAGHYLDLMITLLQDEVQRIVKAKKPLPGEADRRAAKMKPQTK